MKILWIGIRVSLIFVNVFECIYVDTVIFNTNSYNRIYI